MVLGPFAEPKGPRLPGRNPASIVHVNNSPFMLLSNTNPLPPLTGPLSGFLKLKVSIRLIVGPRPVRYGGLVSGFDLDCMIERPGNWQSQRDHLLAQTRALQN